MTTPQAILEEVLAQTSLTEREKEDYRDTFGASLVLMAVDIVGEVEKGWIGGSTVETDERLNDVPREVGQAQEPAQRSGSKHPRASASQRLEPGEGLSAGARWRFYG